MRLDRKLLLIAPTIVLGFVVAGMIYTATELHVLASVGDTWQDRSDFVGAVERGEKPLTEPQAIRLLRFSLQVEEKRTAAITASRDLLVVLSAIALASCATLAVGIRSVPREHWPKLTLRRTAAE